MDKYILMLEDDTDDRSLVKEIVGELDFEIPIRFSSDSQEAFSMMAEDKPSLMLVDYNSTPENGLQVLKRMKADKDLKGIPVVILTENDLEKYRRECYAEGASTVATKPGKMMATRKKIEIFFRYWLEVAEV
ncbi:MAG TPA: response regulator [Flavisolibacter sp.]|jgi:CheY-like chemotaxis protein|nr:response regulator [Flavisolibacter sp.]